MIALNFVVFRLAAPIAFLVLLFACARDAYALTPLSPCNVQTEHNSRATVNAKGIEISLPSSASGPHYELDDIYSYSRPSWRGTHWAFDAVLGNGGILKFTHGGHYCSLDDNEMKRKVFVGNWISRYGAYADVWHASTPNKISTLSVSIEPGGLTEAQALSILASAVTTWEQQ
jgi:hypothetical protein